jgi:hypothetical protein
MPTRAAAILVVSLSLLASSAFAGTASRSFMVGAVVVRSATVATAVSATTGGVRIEQSASRGTPPPMLLVAGELKEMPQSGAAQLSRESGDAITVTLVY